MCFIKLFVTLLDLDFLCVSVQNPPGCCGHPVLILCASPPHYSKGRRFVLFLTCITRMWTCSPVLLQCIFKEGVKKPFTSLSLCFNWSAWAGSLIYETLGYRAFGWPGKMAAFVSIIMQNIGGKSEVIVHV